MEARRGTLALVAADGAAPVSPGAALVEEMLAGWRRQQQARRLTARLIGERERVVRQFATFTGCWPWQRTAAQAEAWVASGGWAHSTVRWYEGALALFLEYVCDPRYGWVSECEQRAGARCRCRCSTSGMNRPGFCGGSQSTGEWDDGSSTEVSGRAA